MIKKLDPDIVITDIRLPGIDGLTMLARCPVNHAIILSGHTDFSYMKQAIRLGVFDYLLKPVDDDELEMTLSNLVTRIREEDIEYDKLRKTKNPTGEELIPLPHSVNNHVIDNAIGFIATNYGKPVGLQEAATFLGLSESHLSRLFKEVTGLNFLQYLNAWRINKSVELMRDPKRNIGEIATSCGFPRRATLRKSSNDSPESRRRNTGMNTRRSEDAQVQPVLPSDQQFSHRGADSRCHSRHLLCVVGEQES